MIPPPAGRAGGSGPPPAAAPRSTWKAARAPSPRSTTSSSAPTRWRCEDIGNMPDDVSATAERVAHADLIRFIAEAYRAVGIATEEAEKAAALMAASDISGADGHGVFRLPQYIRRIKAGGLNTRPDIKVIRQARATALVDGDNGLGSLVVSRAVEEAIALARDNVVGWVGTRNGNHAGAAAVYAAMPG